MRKLREDISHLKVKISTITKGVPMSKIEVSHDDDNDVDHDDYDNEHNNDDDDNNDYDDFSPR